jgi:thiol:disulfide interchange protein
MFNFFSALSYVFGIAVMYASLGYISATSSIIFGRWLASPWFSLFITIEPIDFLGTKSNNYQRY